MNEFDDWAPTKYVEKVIYCSAQGFMRLWNRLKSQQVKDGATLGAYKEVDRVMGTNTAKEYLNPTAKPISITLHTYKGTFYIYERPIANKDKNQVKYVPTEYQLSYGTIGELCSHCGVGYLRLVLELEPWCPDHLQCDHCDSTFNIKETSNE